MNTTIQSLREQGNKTFVEHYRYSLMKNAMLPLKYFRLTNTQGDICSKGGLTIIRTKTPDGKAFFGIAECRSNEAYKRKLGISIALKRLQEAMEK